MCARDGQQACFPPVVDEEELLNFRNLICSRQISNEGPPTARSQTVHRTYTREANEEEEEEDQEVIQMESQNAKNDPEEEGNENEAGGQTSATNPI